ncbi:hypothetical protein PFISCL1PPCAC_25690, partial [Pristionchus fissidentatus]
STSRRRTFFDISIDGRDVGRITFELFDDIVPKTANNIIQLCTGRSWKTGRGGYRMDYNGTMFFRVIKGNMIQGGDFENNDGTGGESIYGGTFEDEDLSGKHDEPFLLTMANEGRNTNGSRFYITTAPAEDLNGKNVIFGKVCFATILLQNVE